MRSRLCMRPVSLWCARSGMLLGPHDITDIVQQITDRTTKTLGTTELVLRHGQNSLSATVKFTSSKKETVFEVAPAVIQQILQMKE